MTTLTELETLAIKAILDAAKIDFDGDSAFTTTAIEILAETAGITENQARGVIGSLCAKNIAYVDDSDGVEFICFQANAQDHGVDYDNLPAGLQ
jgi:hypothetical protein